MNNLFNFIVPATSLVVGGLAILLWLAKQKQLSKSNKRIMDLENEMLRCHREILELNREVASAGSTSLSKERGLLYPIAAAQ